MGYVSTLSSVEEEAGSRPDLSVLAVLGEKCVSWDLLVEYIYTV